jgi:uncharacterized membrane protein
LVAEELVAEIVEEAPRIAARIVQQRKISRSSRWQGPLPRPDDLAQYEQILPGLANRIVAMAEDALEGQVYSEKTLAKGDVDSVRRGQWMAFALGGVAMLLGFSIIVASFWVEDLPWWAGTPFLSVPIFQFLAKLIRSVREPTSEPDTLESNDE